ncbi:MAG: hypothetical protein MJZ34_16590 [Paludibacteraceae bacterium]|nr:hypothetical protein [Paludibacteraceae bacterium]
MENQLPKDYGIKNFFTPAQIEELSQNENVLAISEMTINFTEEFKQLIAEERKHGKTMNQIFKENGINPDYLGQKRIESLRYRINKLNKKREADKQTGGRKPVKSKEQEIIELKNRIKQLENKVTTMEHLNAFLKKIQDLREKAEE